jgi:hypothetical protein
MKTTKKYLLSIPLAVIIFYFIYMNSYVEFQPTVFENSSYKKIEVNNMFDKNLEMVLDYYNVNYKINEQGKVLIKRSLIRDKALLFNYTKKTFDQLWLNSHTNNLKK